MRPLEKRVIVALDVPTPTEAVQLIAQLASEAAGFKVGLELLMGNGLIPLSTALYIRASRFMLDGKFHDIPNTAAKAVRNAASWHPWALTLHCSGGPEMMALAADSARQAAEPRPLLLGVTVLTSLGFDNLVKTGEIPLEVVTALAGNDEAKEAYLRDLVLQRARLAKGCGLDGVVASPKETALLRELGPDFLIVNPGVRPAGSAADDQKRVGTVTQAIRDGADYLVIGRPILQAADPGAALQAINAEVNEALAQPKET
ncbi:MAG: orotidine-5'-phosphate decarboxylase [Candidatus Kerfeldbacteria bacterium]|nr:orotidine-5'-phosphate decarboxylase [Candidatus Kerfeldbacteria bacterium]